MSKPAVPKSTEAFRSISEVADELDVPKHVLRFWEMRFPQIKPMKRGGGRRYYRPLDVELLKGIRHLLHAEGYTIRGVQKIFRDQGADEVQRCWREGAAAVVQAKPAAGKRLVSSPARVTVVDASTAAGDRRRVLQSVLTELTACRVHLASTLGAALPAPGKPMSARGGGRAGSKPVKKRSGL